MHKSFRNNEKTKTKAAFRKDKQSKQGHTASHDLKKKKSGLGWFVASVNA